MQKDKPNAIDQTKIIALDETQVKAYLSVIAWVKSPALDDIEAQLHSKEDPPTTKENKESQAEDAQLFNILSVEPNKDNAMKLFGDK